MSDGARRRILERRARFVAAAMALGASAGVAACEPQVCLEPVLDCDADTRELVIDAPASVCAGDVFRLTAVKVGLCGADAVSPRTVFATSDATLLVIDGASARALKPGTVVVSALFEGNEAKASIVIAPCADAAVDAAVSDSSSEDASDAD